MRIADIYGLVDPRSGLIFYVGKSKDPAVRLKAHLSNSTVNRKKKLVVSELRALDLVPGLVILEEVCEGQSWLDAETFWISKLRAEGVDLVNELQGGNQPPSTEKSLEKWRLKMKGRYIPLSERLKRTGLKRSARTRAKMSAVNHQRPEWRARISSGLMGRVLSDESRLLMSAAAKKRCLDPAFVADLNIRLALGRKKRWAK